MKIGLVLNSRKESSLRLARVILHKLRARGVYAWAECDKDRCDNHRQVDLIMVLGGDGTILRAAREYAPLGVPLVGINLGQVGFLTELEVGEVDEHMDRLVAGDYQIEERLMLGVNIRKRNKPGISYLALNDAVVRSGAARVVEMQVAIDESLLGNYRGDGVICATPTGSTGYSLAAGGPLVWPCMDALVITPINPFVLSTRPLVVDAARSITICSLTTRSVVLTIDGQIEVPLSPGDLVELTGATVKARFAKLKQESLFRCFGIRLCQGGD